MKTHTAVALDGATGRSIAERTVPYTEAGHDDLLTWARGLGQDRYFAMRNWKKHCGDERVADARATMQQHRSS